MQVEGQPERHRKIPSQEIKGRKLGHVTQLVELLTNTHKVLGWIPGTRENGHGCTHELKASLGNRS